jgi:hypothetical protein
MRYYSSYIDDSNDSGNELAMVMMLKIVTEVTAAANDNDG